jgi:DNA-binding transcriptional ArsR family regulator
VSAVVTTLPVKVRKRTFTTHEQRRLKIIGAVRDEIRSSGKTYKQIGEATGLSGSTVGSVARMDTIWPRPKTLFTLLDYFGMELELKR